MYSIHSEYITVANVKEKLQGLDAVLVAQVLEKEELKEKLKQCVIRENKMPSSEFV
jgi:sulfur relay (sulfurtransferase) DsrF/TusC family protein